MAGQVRVTYTTSRSKKLPAPPFPVARSFTLISTVLDSTQKFGTSLYRMVFLTFQEECIVDTSTWIIIGWVAFGALFIWMALCAFVVAGIEERHGDARDTETWHGWLVYHPYETGLPKDTCSYWLRLFLSPAKWAWVAVFWVYSSSVVVLLLTVTPLARLSTHWLFAPVFLGKYVLVTRYKGDVHCERQTDLRRVLRDYVSEGLFSKIGDGYHLHGVIPYTRVKPFVWGALGWLLWATFQHRQPVLRYAAAIPTPMLIGGIVGTAFLLAALLLAKTNKARMQKAWEVLQGKICHEIPIKRKVKEDGWQ